MPMDDRTRQTLVRRKARIEALLPLVSDVRRQRMRASLVEIDTALRIGPVDPSSYLRGTAAAKGLTGTGGLQFSANAPPGIGRLVKVPFYLTTAVANVTTDGGISAAAVANPLVIAPLVAGTRVRNGLFFATQTISWADLRVVGFQACWRWRRGANLAGTALGARPIVVVKNLNLGGGPNLFAQEGYIDATLFTPYVPEFPGLRDNPILQSPNRVFVTAAVLGNDASVTSPTSCTFALNLVCEVLDDEVFGAHVPGPYARRDALARVSPPEGTEMVIR